MKNSIKKWRSYAHVGNSNKTLHRNVRIPGTYLSQNVGYVRYVSSHCVSFLVRACIAFRFCSPSLGDIYS